MAKEIRMVNIRLDELFTESQLSRINAIYASDRNGGDWLVNTLYKRIMKPEIDVINARIGKECDPKYLAYAVAMAVKRRYSEH